jgi:hypothetical protein
MSRLKTCVTGDPCEEALAGREILDRVSSCIVNAKPYLDSERIAPKPSGSHPRGPRWSCCAGRLTSLHCAATSWGD